MIYEMLKKDYLRLRKLRAVDLVKILSPLIAECEAVGKKKQREPTYSECVAVVKSFIKKAEHTLGLIGTKASSYNLVKSEIGVYNLYLPKQLSDGELLDIVSEYIMEESGGGNPENTISMGLVMGYIRANYEGQYNGLTLSKIVKEFLAPTKK